MTPGVTEMSRNIYGLHMLIFWVCVVIALLVFGVMVYSLVKFRKSKGAVPDVTLLLDLPWDAARTRLERRGGGTDRLEAAGADFHRRVRDGYLALAAREPGPWAISR